MKMKTLNQMIVLAGVILVSNCTAEPEKEELEKEQFTNATILCFSLAPDIGGCSTKCEPIGNNLERCTESCDFFQKGMFTILCAGALNGWEYSRADLGTSNSSSGSSSSSSSSGSSSSSSSIAAEAFEYHIDLKLSEETISRTFLRDLK